MEHFLWARLSAELSVGVLPGFPQYAGPRRRTQDAGIQQATAKQGGEGGDGK